MGEGVTGRGGDGQGQAGRGAGILTRAAGALLAGRVPDHARAGQPRVCLTV